MSVGKKRLQKGWRQAFFSAGPKASFHGTHTALLGLGRSQANLPRAELICSSNGRQLLRPPTNCLGLTLFYWGVYAMV